MHFFKHPNYYPANPPRKCNASKHSNDNILPTFFTCHFIYTEGGLCTLVMTLNINVCKALLPGHDYT